MMLRSLIIAAALVVAGCVTNETQPADAASEPADASVTDGAVPDGGMSPFRSEPAGMQRMTEWAFDSAQGEGWSFVDTRRVNVSADWSSPISPPNCALWSFLAGAASGSSPGGVKFNFAPASEIFVGVVWRTGATWTGVPAGITPIVTLGTPAPSAHLAMLAAPATGSPSLVLEPGADNTHVSAACAASARCPLPIPPPTLAQGRWYRLELWMRRSTSPTSRDGAARLWVDGALAQDRADLNFPAGTWTLVSLDPVWGAAGTTKPQAESLWVDHARIAVR